jgi:hypothetical protein
MRLAITARGCALMASTPFSGFRVVRVGGITVDEVLEPPGNERRAAR